MPAGLAEALGATPTYFGRSRFDCIVEVASEDIVRSLSPDFARVKALPTRGLMVTSRASTPGFDFVSRFFGPAVGIDEDPVTGSAHCCLGPYWSKRLRKTELVAYQASERGGVVRVSVRGDRVRLSGRAVTVLVADLLVLTHVKCSWGRCGGEIGIRTRDTPFGVYSLSRRAPSTYSAISP